MGQFANNQVANPGNFPGNAQYPTLQQQTSQFPNNNNNSSQFQGQGGASQYPRGPGGFPGGQFPVGAGQVSSVSLDFGEKATSRLFDIRYVHNLLFSGIVKNVK